MAHTNLQISDGEYSAWRLLFESPAARDPSDRHKNEKHAG